MEDRKPTAGEASLLPPRRRVLIAEDNPSNYELVRDLAEACGWEAVWAADGRETLDALTRCTYDLLLLDLHMPRVDGIQVLEEMRSRGLTERTPTVVLTADALYGVRSDVLGNGVAAILTKPIDVAELMDILAETPRRRR